MASKAEEIKALEKMRKMVFALGGEDSYIGMAFKGVWEIAEQNIDYDWGCNPIEEINDLRNSIEDMTKKKMVLKAGQEKAEKELKETADECKEWQCRAERRLEEIKENERVIGEQADKILALQEQAKAQEQEIMRLKAKLFDLMYAEL